MGVKLPIQNNFQRIKGPTIWVRPTDWPAITDTTGEVQFLMADLGDSNCSINTNFTRNSGTQNIVIDWGDGTTNTISTTASTTTNHTYTSGAGTACSLGYTTFKIRVYFTGAGVSVMRTCSIGAVYLSGNTYTSQTCHVLEAYYGDGTVPTTPAYFHSSPGNGSSAAIYSSLKYVKHPSTVSWTNIQNIFNSASSLARVVMPTSMPLATSSNNAFQNCYDLEEVTFASDATGLNNFQYMFSSCYNLQRVTFPTTLNSCTTFSNAFQNCNNLRYLVLPALNSCATFSQAFNACYQLEWVKFTGMPTVAGTINFSNAFASCMSLQNMYFPATGVSTNTYNFANCFQTCPQLKSVILPSNINVSSFAATFSGCIALTTCVLPTTVPACFNMTSIFQSCYALTNVTLPSTVSSLVDLGTAFNGCYKLESLTIPSTYNISGMNNTFGSCFALKTLNWNPGAQNSLTTLASAFSGCRNLIAITLPTSMNLLNSLNSTFSSCNSLESITFPTSLNAVTTLGGAFLFCVGLKSIIFPTSMSACTNFSQMFQGCPELRSVTLPNTVSAAITTFSGAFYNCFALETIVFPGAAQLSSITNISSAFSYCSNLKTLTNFDKIGSLSTLPLLDASSLTYNRLTSISFVAPLTSLILNGGSSVKTDVQSVRLLNTSAGQWTGSSPQINVSYTNMSTANLVQLFTDMAAQGNVTSKTINITAATGTAGLSAANRLIITSKGWTITG